VQTSYIYIYIYIYILCSLQIAMCVYSFHHMVPLVTCNAHMISMVQEHHEGKQCLVVGDPIIRNVGTGQNNMMAECFPGIRTEQLHRVLNNRDIGTPDTVVIHVGRNDLKRLVKLDYVMGEVYSLVNKAKVKFPQSKIVLSGVLWQSDVAWRRIEVLNDRYD